MPRARPPGASTRSADRDLPRSPTAQRPTRSRYVGVEVEGGEPPSIRELGHLLALRLAGGPQRGLPAPLPWLRVVRAQGPRAIVEIAHTDLASARTAWNGPLSEAPEPRGPPALGARGRLSVRTRRTWGTLKDAKLWLARASPA